MLDLSENDGFSTNFDEKRVKMPFFVEKNYIFEPETSFFLLEKMAVSERFFNLSQQKFLSSVGENALY